MAAGAVQVGDAILFPNTPPPFARDYSYKSILYPDDNEVDDCCLVHHQYHGGIFVWEWNTPIY